MLTHPVRRTADPMLEFFCRAESDEEAMKVMNDVPLVLLGIIIQILLQYCYSIGRMADVRRSLDFYYRVQRQQKELEGPGASERRRWSLRTRREATSAGIAEGLPLT
jgi:hypothetical protein